MKTFKSIFPKAVKIFLAMTLLCGVIYPLIITGISQIFFKEKANGSIIEINGKKYGSELLGQQFAGKQYLWGRIMYVDTDTFKDKNGNAVMFAGPSNLSPASDEYRNLIAKRVAELKRENPDADPGEIPVDLVTCSGSGLDPHISVAAAYYQIPRIAKNRNISDTQVKEIINKYTTGRFMGIFGEKVVNVLKVNLALDGILK